MGVTTFLTSQDALGDTQRAFDRVAAGYDGLNEANPVIRWMRARLQAAVRRHVPAGGHLLDLGCGPGRDAVTLAADGYRVTAIDWSSEMTAETAARVRTAGLGDRVDVRTLGIQHLDALDAGPFDGAYSDLGPLNCVPDPGAAARALAARVRPGGVLVASVIGRGCPWELALYTARRQWTRAAVRFNAGLVPVPLEGGTVWTRYYWPREFAADWRAAGFVPVSWHGLGLLAPPPYIDGFARRHPRLIRALTAMDDALGGLPGARNLGDHFLMVLRRR